MQAILLMQYRAHSVKQRNRQTTTVPMKQEHNTMETKGFTGQKYELMGQVVLGTKHNRKHHVKLEFQINIEQYMEYLGHTYTKRLLIADLKFHVTLI